MVIGQVRASKLTGNSMSSKSTHTRGKLSKTSRITNQGGYCSMSGPGERAGFF